MSRTIRNLTLALGVALLGAPIFASAQPGQGAPGGLPPEGRPRGMQGPTQRPMQRSMQHRGPGDAGERQGGITHLLNARRELDLTPRQIIQLDSLERIQYAERKQFNDRMRGARDSMMTRARSGARTPAARDSMQAQARARMEAERPQVEQRRRRDSSMSAAAERILNDAQRQKVREMTAERRGYERGMRESRAPREVPRGEMRGEMRGDMGPRRPPVERPEGR